MGAVVGGVFAAGQLEHHREWVLGLSQRGVLQNLDPSLTTAGVLGAERVLSRMVELFGGRRGSALPPADDSESLPSVTMLEVMRLSLDAAQSALTRHSLAAYPPDVLITVPMDACHTSDFHRASELIDLGRDLAREALDRNP